MASCLGCKVEVSCSILFPDAGLLPGIVRLFSYPYSYCSSVPVSCILFFVIKIVNLRLSSSGLSLGGRGHRRTRSTVEDLAENRSRLWLRRLGVVSVVRRWWRTGERSPGRRTSRRLLDAY